MINKIILMGRLTANPELRQTTSGVACCKFDVACNRQYSDKQTGERQADFISVQAWRQTAEFVAKYFAKGKMIIVEGSLRNNNYTDKNGVKHYSMVVQADNVTFGESKGNSEPQSQSQPVMNTVVNPQGTLADMMKQGGIPNESLQIGNVSDFEVLSDGDTPF